MGLKFNNQVGLIKTILRCPKEPTLKYLNNQLPKKFTKLKPHLAHYKRFLQEPDIMHAMYGEDDITQYGSYLKLIGKIMGIRILWKKCFNEDFEPFKTPFFIGNSQDILISAQLLYVVITVTEKVIESEKIKYKADMARVRRWDRNVGQRLERMQDTRIFSREFKLQVIYFINALLISLLENKRYCPHDALIIKYIERNFKLKWDNKRGNPNWTQDKLRKEDYIKALSKDFKFRENKLLV